MRMAVMVFGAAVVARAAAMASGIGSKAQAQVTAEPPMTRIAELEIDPAQLEACLAILAEEQEASVRLEPGMLMLHSVALADNPIRLLEVYASREAYENHLRRPHFIKYKTATEGMVKSLRLIETRPILLCAKSRGRAGGPVTCI